MQQKIFIFGWARGVGNFFIVKKFAQPNSSWSSVIYAAYDYTSVGKQELTLPIKAMYFQSGK